MKDGSVGSSVWRSVRYRGKVVFKKNNNSNHKNWIIVVALFFQVTAK